MNKNLKNLSIVSLSFLLALCVFTACDDWTKPESLEMKQPNIQEQNPELYDKYIKNLIDYKKLEHKALYAWFDNSVKTPFNRSHHIDNLPDSVDVVVLMHPDNLQERELKEMENLRKEKHTKVIFSLSYDALKFNYDNLLAEQDPSALPSFTDYLVKEVKHQLELVAKYNYDGICVAYNGRNMRHMTDEEKKVYIENESSFITLVKAWFEADKTKTLVFEGMPQNLVDKDILTSCQHIILPTYTALNDAKLNYIVQMASVEGVPVNRFVVTAATTSLDKADIKTGYWADGSQAILSTALWAAASYPNFRIAGLGVYNVNNDYFNIQRTYKSTRGAINIMNPSVKK